MTAFAGLPCRKSLLPDWKSIVVGAYPVLGEVNLDVVTEVFEEGYAQLDDEFKKQAESEALILPALEKVFQVGDSPVDYFKEVAQQVTDLNRA